MLDVCRKRRSRRAEANRLATETVEGAALPLEGVDDVEGGDGLALGVLSVGDGVADDTLEEGLEDTAGLLVDHGGDTLDTATTRQTADGGLGDTLDVVAQNLAVALGTALSKTLAALSAWRGCQYAVVWRWRSAPVTEAGAESTHVQTC